MYFNLVHKTFNRRFNQRLNHDSNGYFQKCTSQNHFKRHQVQSDAKFLLNLAKKHQIAPKTVVSSWKSVLCEDIQLARSINIRHLQYPHDLYMLASSIVVEKCTILCNHPRRTVKFVITALLNLKRSATMRDEILQLLGSAVQRSCSPWLGDMLWNNFTHIRVLKIAHSRVL